MYNKQPSAPMADANTTSLDLPPHLAELLSAGAPTQMAMGSPGVGLQGAMMGLPEPQAQLPQYEQGGMIGPGGMPQPSAAGVDVSAQSGTPMDSKVLDMHINQFASQNPAEVQKIQQAIAQALQSGELTPQELNMVVQLATATAQNPAMYPNIRRFAIQQGIATEQDLPQDYDQGLVFTLLTVAKSMQHSVGGQGGAPTPLGPLPPAPQVGPGGMPSMASGGPVPQSHKPSGGVVIEAHQGEYVIPKRVVEMKGREFFDNLVEKYRDGQ